MKRQCQLYSASKTFSLGVIKMEELVGYLIGGIILIVIIVYVVMAIAAILLSVIGVATCIGLLSGGFIALKTPFIYFSHLYKRCK